MTNQHPRRMDRSGEIGTGRTTGEAAEAVYAELQPIDRHRAFIDHLFVLRDCGRLTAPGRYLFASPFSAMAVVGRSSDRDDGAAVWKAIHSPPRFGRQARQRRFHGWIFGIRCQPLDSATADAALAELSERLAATVSGDGPFDPVIIALDGWLDGIAPCLTATDPPQRHTKTAAPLDSILFTQGKDRGTSVASWAAAEGVAPRTLQRHVRDRTGLAPKRFATVQRFNAALRQIAPGEANLAEIATDAGYCDQAHLTVDVSRHAGVSPGRFRAQARRQVVQDAVRFFQRRRPAEAGTPPGVRFRRSR